MFIKCIKVIVLLVFVAFMLICYNVLYNYFRFEHVKSVSKPRKLSVSFEEDSTLPYEDFKTTPSTLRVKGFEIRKSASPKEKFKMMMERRISHVKSGCASAVMNGKTLTSLSSLGLPEYGPVKDSDTIRLWWFRDKGVAYCPVYKSASTSWKRNLLHFRHKTWEAKRLIKKYPQKASVPIKYYHLLDPTIKYWNSQYSSGNISSSLISFIVVRHPFDRLISAYRQKFESGKQMAGLGSIIIKRYRKNDTKILKQLFLASPMEGKSVSFKWRVPTFWEFSRWVLENRHYKNFEIHWMPIYQQCSVCHPTKLSTLNYILKFEELAVEEKQFIDYVHWNHIIPQTAQSNVYATKKNNELNMTPRDITKMYFRTLDKECLLRLYQKYKPDFLLFNYTFKLDEWI